jgi:hypothetical protein
MAANAIPIGHAEQLIHNGAAARPVGRTFSNSITGKPRQRICSEEQP